MSAVRHGGSEDRPDEQPKVVIRDRRRLDPTSGELRQPSGPPPPTPADSGAPPGAGRGAGSTSVDPAELAALTERLEAAEASVAERTGDLLRLKAEYDNYRKRVARDREAVQEQAIAAVLANFLSVLDDIGRARQFGELEGGFRQVGEAVEQITGKLGLVGYGQVGDPFDPAVHEAVSHAYSEELTGPTCVQIMQPGYRLGERILRPAFVAVAEPDPDAVQTDVAGTDSLGSSADAEITDSDGLDSLAGEEPVDRR